MYMRIFVGVPRKGDVKQQLGCRSNFHRLLLAVFLETLDRINAGYNTGQLFDVFLLILNFVTENEPE